MDFWITNISAKNVTLSDLGITIKAHSSMNLLDSNHYSFTYDQLKKSLLEGSINAKKNIIKISSFPVKRNKVSEKTISKRPMVKRKRSAVVVEEPKFDDFIFSDEQYAQEMSRDFENDNFNLSIK